jgi:integrase/recombinase XerD
MAIKLPKYITFDEAVKIIKNTDNLNHKVAFTLGFFCGLRISEVTNLKPEDVNLDTRELFISQSKNDKDRYVPIPKPVLPALKYLPITIGNRALQQAINTQSEKLIGRKIHFHTLRHSSATHYMNMGIDLNYLQRFLGHSDIGTTTVYLHINPKRMREKILGCWE